VTFRTKLMLALAPLALALAAVGVVSSIVTTALARQASLILADNYRSVLAAQRMKEAVERIDGQVYNVLADREGAAAAIARHRADFESELGVQRANITEQGERDATGRLLAGWSASTAALDRLFGAVAPGERQRFYFETISPAFATTRKAADEILAINQDAMVRKSRRAEQRAVIFERLMLSAVALASLLGLVASVMLTTRLLRPLGVVAAAVRRFGQGDTQARARVQGKDEAAQLATEFNTMADRLERYRRSSLGELLQAQQAAQAAIDGLPDPVVMLGPGGNVQGANQAASSVLRIDVEAGGSLEGADAAVRAVLDRLRAHVVGGRGAYVPRGFEEALRIASSEGERIYLPRATPIYGEGRGVAGVAVVLQEVTRLFRFDELKNNLVATVAHEFRTPLTSLRMALHLCTEEVVGPLTPKQADLLFAARDDCERLQSIVDDLLNLSRLESGRIDLNRRRADPDALVGLALDVHHAAAQSHRLTLRAEVAPGLSQVFADPDRLQLVFTNLLNNAIRYSPPDGEVIVRARRDEEAVRFEVVDRGPGIAPEHQSGLFEKFFRVPGSPQGGSGLGLFIARGIVQAHGGRIGVESAAGAGATFWFTIPVAPPSPS
jgi:NtrC-family two-component system sensor histidine kinase KinB